MGLREVRAAGIHCASSRSDEGRWEPGSRSRASSRNAYDGAGHTSKRSSVSCMSETGTENPGPPARGSPAIGSGYRTFVSAITAFVPPKPNEFDSTASTRFSRAVFGM